MAPKKTPTSAGKTIYGFAISPDSPHAWLHQMIDALESRMPSDKWLITINPRRFKEAAAILKSEPRRRAEAIASLLTRKVLLGEHLLRVRKEANDDWHHPSVTLLVNYGVCLKLIIISTLRSKSGWTAKTLEELRAMYTRFPQYDSPIGFCGNYMLSLTEAVAKHEPLPATLAPDAASATARPDYYGNVSKESRRRAERVAAILGKRVQTGWDKGDPWAKPIAEEIKKLPKAAQSNWAALIQHAGESSGAKAGVKWSKQAATLLEAIPQAEFVERVSRWFRAVVPPPVKYRPGYMGKALVRNSEPIRDRNVKILRGLVWMCGLREDERLAAPLGDLALVGLKKYPGYAAFCVQAGNACVDVLTGMKGHAPMAQLSRLQSLL